MCVSSFCETFRSSPVVDVSVHGDHGSGAAKRRRDRRLRMHWRHEQLTLQMALAAALHHSRDVGPVSYNALRSQRTARAVATNNAMRSQKNSVAGDTEFFSLYEDELSGRRPEASAELRPQDCVKRHRGAHHRSPLRSDPRRSCAADGGQRDRSAQDLVLILSFPGGSS